MLSHLTTLESTLFFSSKQSIVTGRVAELDEVLNAVIMAMPMFPINLKGSFLTINPIVNNAFLLVQMNWQIMTVVQILYHKGRAER